MTPLARRSAKGLAMIHRTKTGKALHRSSPRGKKRKAGTGAGSPLAHLGAVTWAFGLLMVSVALAAAAVFTHKG
jgi:hypothetical protein